MVEQNQTIEITQADMAEALQNKVNQITNLELQVAALKRTVIELRSEPEEDSESAEE
tara:strand:+ start:339 stop:509 length:171 start_codon:yes stop_codon:yes gene_type:complete